MLLSRPSGTSRESEARSSNADQQKSNTDQQKTTQLLQQCRRLLSHSLAVLAVRKRWLYLTLLLVSCVVFANLSQEQFVMESQGNAELCMLIFMVYYVASLSFILSFDTSM